MGDVLTLVEKARRQFDEDQAADLEKKIRKGTLTLDDFLAQMQQMRRWARSRGSSRCFRAWASSSATSRSTRSELDRLQAIITSMTPEERANPAIINGSRRRRIAAGPARPCRP